MPRLLCRGYLMPLIVSLAACNLNGQQVPNPLASTPNRAASGIYDREFNFPTAQGELGHKDPAAVAAVAAYLHASARGLWTGFDANGIMTIGEGQASRLFPAALDVQEGNRYRLDIRTPGGTRGIRTDGATGAVQREDGKTTPLPASSAAAGLIPLPITVATAATNPRSSLLDGGIVEVDGRKLQKVTFIRPLFPKSNRPPLSLARPLVTDLFFDSETHLLVKSVDAIFLDLTSQTQHLRVVTYALPHNIEGIIVPFRYIETIDGRRSWTLELTEATAQPSHEAAYFHF